MPFTFNSDNFPFVKITFLGKIKTDIEFDEFTDLWEKLYERQRNGRHREAQRASGSNGFKSFSQRKQVILILNLIVNLGIISQIKLTLFI